MITWASKKQKAVSRSSTESEYRALSSTATELVWVAALLSELGFNLPDIPKVWCDNQGAHMLASHPVFHSRTKHIEVDVHYVRDLVMQKKLAVSYIPTEEQPADIYTKPLTFPKFSFLCSKLSLDFVPSSLRGRVEEMHVVTK